MVAKCGVNNHESHPLEESSCIISTMQKHSYNVNDIMETINKDGSS